MEKCESSGNGKHGPFFLLHLGPFLKFYSRGLRGDGFPPVTAPLWLSSSPVPSPVKLNQCNLLAVSASVNEMSSSITHCANKGVILSATGFIRVRGPFQLWRLLASVSHFYI